MKRKNKLLQKISYVSSAQTRTWRTLICVMEYVGGPRRLLQRVSGDKDEVADGKGFWQVMIERYGIDLNLIKQTFDNNRKNCSLIIMENNSYGILDGLVMGYLLSKICEDFRILANDVFSQSYAAR
jgi:hypothetical protein